jgi:hypothetical protein
LSARITGAFELINRPLTATYPCAGIWRLGIELPAAIFDIDGQQRDIRPF